MHFFNIQIPTVVCKIPRKRCLEMSPRHDDGGVVLGFANGCFALVFFFAFLLSGCGSSDVSESNESPPAANPSAVDKRTDNLGPLSITTNTENRSATEQPVQPVSTPQESPASGPPSPNETTPGTTSLTPVKPTTDTLATPTVVAPSSNAKPETVLTEPDKPDSKGLPTRLPIPDKEAIRAALKMVIATFNAEFKAARTSKSNAPKMALMKTLRLAAKEKGNGPATNYALLQRARELAIEISHVDSAMEITDEVAARFEIDDLESKAESLSACTAGTRNPKILLMVYRRGSELAHPAIEADKFAAALAFVDVASSAASKARNRDQVRAMSKQRSKIISLRGKFKKAQTAIETLKDNPDNEAANLLLGIYLCVTKNDWLGAASHLEKCSVPVLQQAASLELSKPSEPDIQAQIGDKWWQAAQRKRNDEREAYLARAGHWYRKAHRHLSGLKKLKLTSRLRQLNGETIKQSLLPGFLVRLYDPLETQQQGEPRLEGKEQLGDPVGKSKVTKSISGWRYEGQYNATATGFLKIDEPGKYTFRSENFYTRNLMYLDGKLVQKYRQMSLYVVELDIGLHPMVSVGTPGARGSVTVTWMPPGKTTLEPIPLGLLFHKPPMP